MSKTNMEQIRADQNKQVEVTVDEMMQKILKAHQEVIDKKKKRGELPS